MPPHILIFFQSLSQLHACRYARSHRNIFAAHFFYWNNVTLRPGYVTATTLEPGYLRTAQESSL